LDPYLSPSTPQLPVSIHRGTPHMSLSCLTRWRQISVGVHRRYLLSSVELNRPPDIVVAGSDYYSFTEAVISAGETFLIGGECGLAGSIATCTVKARHRLQSSPRPVWGQSFSTLEPLSLVKAALPPQALAQADLGQHRPTNLIQAIECLLLCSYSLLLAWVWVIT
jgi:hypothetical protein